ncbi:hypothetical protein E2C01_036516 [Portunus trituberculatus]|uniref:Uncharacterized protein n=1 Tax=Portunus trituberculatus TaxID=210409 RepID=A0A5B7FED2_PORTR|nr:hypothetical protein [Portunus trituberculatus]
MSGEGIQDYRKKKLNISQATIERAHRVGKVTAQRCRDIVAKFACFPERDAVFRVRSKLKGMNIFINEDFCPGTVEVRRSQMDAIKEARRNGKQAFFNYRTLVVRDSYRSEGGGRDRHAGGGMVHQPSTPRTPPRTTTHPHPTTTHQGTPATSRPAVTTHSTSSTVTTATPCLTWGALASASPGRGGGGSDEVGAMALPQRHRGSPAEKMQLRERSSTQYKF